MYWTSNEYVRRFWIAFAAFPITGLLLILFMPMPFTMAFGTLLILWPFSIPARSIIFTGRAAKRVLSPTRMVAEGEHLYFITDPMDHNYRVNKRSIRDVVVRKEYLVIELWKFKMIYVPREALKSENDIERLRTFCEVN